MTCRNNDAMMCFVCFHNLQLGRMGLVRQLRDSDTSGAPLLFRAASSDSLKCFGAVCDAIRNTVGLRDLKEQLMVRTSARATMEYDM